MKSIKKPSFKNDFPRVSKNKIILGLLLGVGYAFSFYCLLNISSEIIRYYTITDTYELWVFADHEIQFYNLFIAYLSVIIGQSVAFIFIYDIPRFRLGSSPMKKRLVINDQRNLLWYFLAWSSKVTLVYYFTVILFLRNYTEVSFYPEFNYLFVLIIIVLFLHPWQSIRTLYPRKSLKWMFASFVITSLLSIGMSKFNIVDHNALNHKILSKNLRYKYDIKTPTINSSLITDIEYRDLAKIHIAENDVPGSDSEFLLFFNHYKVSLEELDNNLETLMHNIPNHFRRHPPILYIDNDITLQTLNQIKEILSKNNIYTIAYHVWPLENPHFNSYYSFKVRLVGYFDFTPEEKKHFEANSSKLEISKTGDFIINKNYVSVDNLAHALQNQMVITSNTHFTFRYDESIHFEMYLKVLTSYNLAINNLRDELAMEDYQKTYNSLSRPERDIIKRQFPHVLYETPISIKEANSIIPKMSQ